MYEKRKVDGQTLQPKSYSYEHGLELIYTELVKTN